MSGGTGAAARWSTAAAAAAIAATALAFRLLRLESVPPGLYVDEVLTARNALAWRLAPEVDWLGSRPLLQAGWVETANLYLAFASAVMRLFGDGLVGVRMISVLPSLAAVALLCGLGAEVGGRRVGLLAAFLLGASHWAARTGRTGWDQVLMVALQLAALWLLARATRRGRALPGLAAGALLGLSLHTYVAARLAVLHALLWQAWETLPRRRVEATSGGDGAGHSSRARWAFLALAIVVAALPVLLRDGTAGGVRVGQLAAWQRSGPGEPWATLAESAAAHVTMFHVRGGAYARDALPGWPMLDPVTGVLLLVGLVAVARTPGWRRRLLVSWPIVVVLGGILSVSGEGPPYPYRVGSLPAWACLVAALGGVHLWDALGRRERPAVLRGALAGALLAAVLAVNAWALFVAGPRYPGTRHVYGTTPTRIGLWLRDHRDGRPTFVLRDALRPPPVRGSYRDATANRVDFFRPVDAAAAVQLAAGLYGEHPRRSLDPLAPAGDVDVVAALPQQVAADALVVVSPAGAATLAPAAPARRRVELRHGDGTPLAVVFEPPRPHPR